MPCYDALIFDLDGTLIDSAPDIAAGVNISFAERGWPTLEVSYVERFIGNGSRRLIADILEDKGIDATDAEIDTALERYLEAYCANPAGHTHVFERVREDLEALRDAGIRLGICTNKPHELTGRVLEALGLAGLFDAAVGQGVTPACKPDPSHLLEVATRMKLDTKTWAYVGDTVIDQAAAQALDVPFFVVPWGTGPGVPVADEQRLTRLRDLLDMAPGQTIPG